MSAELAKLERDAGRGEPVADFLAVSKGIFKPRTERAMAEVENAVRTLIIQTNESSLVAHDDVLETIKFLIKKIDQEIYNRLNEFNKKEGITNFFDWLRRENVYPNFESNNAFAIAMARVHELGAYKDSWNGQGTNGPTTQAVRDAGLFLTNWNFDILRIPHITLTDDGEINFLWKIGTDHFDLGFFGDGTYSFFGKMPGGWCASGDHILAHAPLPPELLRHLSIEG